MRWIGFGVQPLGSVQNEGDIRQQVRGGMATTERMTQAGVGRISQPTSKDDGGGRGGGQSRIPGGGANNMPSGGAESNDGNANQGTGRGGNG